MARLPLASMGGCSQRDDCGLFPYYGTRSEGVCIASVLVLSAPHDNSSEAAALDLLKQLAKLLPTDPSDRAGYGPFRLPEDAEWMESVFAYHDHYYTVGPQAGMRLSDIDWRVFKALTIAAEVPEDTIERCHRAHQVCTYWPIMRSIGHFLYNRHGVQA